MNNLTDREFWAKYWADHHIYKVPESQYYDFLIEGYLKEKDGKKFIELVDLLSHTCKAKHPHMFVDVNINEQSN